MTTINRGTQKYQQVLWQWNSVNKGDINQAYARPSAEKVRTFNDIWYRAMQTEGYNHDLKVVGASSFSYSTMYSFTQDSRTFVVYDTVCNTFIFEI